MNLLNRATVLLSLSAAALTVRYLTDRFIHDYDPTFGKHCGPFNCEASA